MRPCECLRPNEHADPRFPATCVQCGYSIPSAWSDVGPFFDWLEDAFARDFTSLRAIRAMRLEAEARNAAGRSTFGLRHLSRDNAEEGKQEASDGANYAAYYILGQQRREEDPEWPLALTAAFHCARAHDAFDRLQRHAHTPISDA